MILNKMNFFICTISLIFISCDNFFAISDEEDDYQCEYGVEGIQKTLGPTTYTDWEYFSILGDSTIHALEITEEEANVSTDWDIALLRNHFRTNSGLSGPGNGGAAMIDQEWTCESFNQLTNLPDNIIFEEDAMLDNIYQPWAHEDPDEAYTEAPGSIVLENWGWFDLDNDYTMNITNRVLFIKLTNDRYLKIWLYDYYDDDNQSGHVSFYYDFIDSSN